MPNDVRHFGAGALSGFTVRFLTQPFDVLKIRFQLQVEPIRRGAKSSYYLSVSQAFGRILREEGLFALWKGHVPGQFLSMIFCGTEFAVFYGLAAIPVFQSSLHRDFGFGIAAGVTAATCCQPLDVMRTRLIAQGPNKVYAGFIRGIGTLVRTEGTLALWRGLGPSCLLVAPQTAITFAVYEKIRRFHRSYWTETNDNHTTGSQKSDRKQSNIISLYAGSIAGLVAKTSVYPLDLIKKRLAIRGFEDARSSFGKAPAHYTSASYKLSRTSRSSHQTQWYATWACFRGILANEGVGALFKGWTPSAMKAMISTGLTFYLYEQFDILLNRWSSMSHRRE